MYAAMILLLTALGIIAIYQGVVRRSIVLRAIGFCTVVAVPTILVTMSVWGEWLWFENLGYSSRFLTGLSALSLMSLVGGLLGGLGVYLLRFVSNSADQFPRYLARSPARVGRIFTSGCPRSCSWPSCW